MIKMCIICAEIDKKRLSPWEALKNLMEMSSSLEESHLSEVNDKIDLLFESENEEYCWLCTKKECDC